MELVMPNNYVVLEEEEMMYLDGGDLGLSAVLGIVSGVLQWRELLMELEQQQGLEHIMLD